MPRVYPPIEGRQPAVNISPSLVESTAGFTAGIVSTLVVHPFDMIKTRLQLESRANSLLPGNSWRVIRAIASETQTSTSVARKGLGMNDVTRAFYRGLMPNMLGNSVSWALYFMWYGKIKEVIRTTRVRTHHEHGEDGEALNSSDYFLASGVSGVLTAVFTNPIWVIKTRMLSTAKSTPGAYRSMGQGTRELFQKEGIKGFYRGLLPSLFGVSHGAIQFMAYEQLKNRWGRSRKGGTKGLTNLDFLSLSAVSKMLAGTVTYPYQVVRARLQTYDAQTRYRGAWDVVRQVWRGEGLGGFYRGLGPNLVRVVPSTCVTFLVYENCKFYLPRMLADEEEEGVADLA